MPELPEVETVVRYLRPELTGRQIVDFKANWPKVTAPTPPEVFTAYVAGRSIQSVDRRGKYIILNLDTGLIHLHLRMTGSLSVVTSTTGKLGPHITAEIQLDKGKCLLFRDIRKFGRIGYLTDMKPLDNKLGVEPLSEEFTPDAFYGMLKGHRRQIKPLLLDQRFIAGLGNIYVDEALFLSGIHPENRSATLSYEDTQILHDNIRRILLSSIEHKGTTIMNFRYGENEQGSFRRMLQVFRQEGSPCPVCGNELVKIRVAQRGTHICLSCQPKKKPRRKR